MHNAIRIIGIDPGLRVCGWGVVVEGAPLEPGSLHSVRVTGAAAYDLFATLERAATPALTVLH